MSIKTFIKALFTDDRYGGLGGGENKRVKQIPPTNAKLSIGKMYANGNGEHRMIVAFENGMFRDHCGRRYTARGTYNFDAPHPYDLNEEVKDGEG